MPVIIPKQSSAPLDKKSSLFTATWFLFFNALNDFVAAIAARTSLVLQHLLVTLNTGTLPAEPSDTLVSIAGQDEHGAGLLLEAFTTANNSPNLSLRRARGTASSPTAVQLNDFLGAITFLGMGATVLGTGSRARIEGRAAENWSDTAQGTYLAFWTTPTGAAVLAEVARILASGAVLIAQTADNASGAKLQVTGSESLTDSLILIAEAAPALSAAAQARLYLDSTSNTVKLSQNNGAYADVIAPPQALYAKASATLTLTTSYVDIPSCTVTLNKAGVWLILGVANCNYGGGNDTAILVQLLANGAAQTGLIQSFLTAASGNVANGPQTWLYTTANTTDVAKLQAKKNTGTTGTSFTGADSTITAVWLHA